MTTATHPFRKYDHLERLGHRMVQGIDMGLVYVFPKLDGTNASIWHDPESGNTQTASRRRVLSLDDDNAGFCAWATGGDEIAERLRALCREHPNWILYGEWLVPHTLRTYRQEVWRKFWIFDVYDRDQGTYLAYDEYRGALAAAELDYIEPLCTIQDPGTDQLIAQCETNTYLIAENAGVGEGVVLKNYAWRQHGHPWAKIVRNVFKEKAARAHGHAEKQGEFNVELAIAEEFVTPHLVGKTRAKVVLDIANDVGISTEDPNFQHQVEAEYRNRVIPQLLGRVFHDLIEEEMWAIVKKYEKKSPVINLKSLRGRVTLQVKALAEDLF